MTLSGTAILTKIRKFPQFGGSESHIYNPSQSTVKVEKKQPSIEDFGQTDCARTPTRAGIRCCRGIGRATPR